MSMSVGAPAILVVDDEPEIRKFLRMNLEARGFEVIPAQDGKEGMKLFRERSIDLAIVDLSMPGPDGFEVCRRIREVSRIPIIILSASSREADKVKALDLGADDYVTKPFGVPELVARVGATLRRSGRDESKLKDSYDVGGVSIDLATRRIVRDGKSTSLTSTEYSLLCLLLRNRGEVLTHRHILETVWGPSAAEEREYLRAYMYRLRRKIERDPSDPVYIRNVPGVGYRFGLDGEDQIA